MSAVLVLPGWYDVWVVILSIVISVLGAYATLELAERMNTARGAARAAWQLGGATASGLGTWSMHYVAMLAFHIPVRVLYDWHTVLVSLVPAVAAAAVALLFVRRRAISWPAACAASVLIGGGIAILHYTGMAAMRFPGMHAYDPSRVAVSAIVAMLLSLAALKLTFVSPGGAVGSRARKTASLLFLGAANPVMHFTGMAATTFVAGHAAPDLGHIVDITAIGVAGVTSVGLVALGVALLTTTFDRLQEQRALLDELFEQAPQAVALTQRDDRVVRVNRDFARLFGYAPHEIVGRRLAELIVPDEARDEEQRAAELLAQGRRVDLEVVRRRKDGARLQVALVRVPVTTPRGEVSSYAIYHDITERKRAEEVLQTFSKRLIAAQEAERRRVALELHDQIGQLLTALMLELVAVQHAAADPALAKRLDETIELVGTAIGQVQDLSFDLRPSLLDDLGLVAALREYVGREGARAGVEAELVAGPLPDRLPPELETTCFRIAQEALTNAVRHARARHVRVELEASAGELRLLVRDDGVGFDPSAVRRDPASERQLGLLGMEERALIVGGRIEIRSAPGRGTEVEARLPLPMRAPDSGANVTS